MMFFMFRKQKTKNHSPKHEAESSYRGFGLPCFFFQSSTKNLQTIHKYGELIRVPQALGWSGAGVRVGMLRGTGDSLT